MAVDRDKIESFLYREARLMDENEYDQWLSLWAEDALYWVPSNHDSVDPMREMSLIYTDRRGLEERVTMLKSGDQWSQEPKSRMRRIVSNVEIEEGDNGEVTVYSNFDLTEFRRGRQEIYAGRNIHRLLPEGDSYRIASKKVLLVRNDDYLHNLTFLI